MCGGLAEVSPDTAPVVNGTSDPTLPYATPWGILYPGLTLFPLYINALRTSQSNNRRHLLAYRHTDGTRGTSRSGDFPYADFGDCQYLLHLEAFLSMRGLSPPRVDP